MCKLFKVSRSGFYAWLNSSPSNRSVENKHITDQIVKAHHNSKKIYGSPRIAIELNNQGIKVSRPRVARLMKEAKIRSILKKKFKVTTDSRHKYPIVENKLDRQFKAEKPGTAWVSDITYIKTKQGWLYLTIVLDLGDRKVVGW
jgi:putative transposase